MIIRPATHDDVDVLAAMVQHFLEAVPTYAALLQGGPERLVAYMHGVVELKDALTLLALEDTGEPLGFITVVAVENVLTETRVGDELVWWVEPRFRGRVGPKLLEAAEAWARTTGLSVLKMVAPYQSRVGVFYERHGYVPLETSYTKGLDHGSRPHLLADVRGREGPEGE